MGANELEASLGRLHELVLTFVRGIAEKHRLRVDPKGTSLHTVLGDYIARLRSEKHLKSASTEHRLKATISVLEVFDNFCDERRLARDTAVLTYEEALLLFNHVTESIRFLQAFDQKIDRRR